MKRSEAQQVVMVLRMAFADGRQPMSPAEIKAWSDVYAAGIEDLDFEECKAAVDRLVKTANFMPRVAEIRAAVLDVTRGQSRSGAEAWGDVKRAVSRYGIYRHPEFDDPIVGRVVSGLGWRELCNSENETADRARFVDAYNELTKQGRVEAQVSKGAAAPALPARTAGVQLVEHLAAKLKSGDEP